jgi:hypothetical protein
MAIVMAKGYQRRPAIHYCAVGGSVRPWRKALRGPIFMARHSPASLEGGERRRIKDSLVAALERLWQLRHRTLDLASIGGGTIHDPKLRLVPSVRNKSFPATLPESRVKSV